MRRHGAVKGCTPMNGGSMGDFNFPWIIDREKRLSAELSRKVSRTDPDYIPEDRNGNQGFRFGGCQNQEMNMTEYLLLMLAVIAASLVAVCLYRYVFRRKLFGQRVVSLSDGSGHFQHRRQRGFIHPRADTSQRKTAGDKGPIRKPWGW